MKKLLATVLFATMSLPALAWGPQGHALVALIAADHLTPVARRNVKALLGTESLADVASWPDAYRPLVTQTGAWHYVDIPEGTTTYVRDRDCPPQPGVKLGAASDKWRDCVVDRILFFEQRAGDAALDPADRAVALKYLVHFIGDIHQPMHAMNLERGGNGINVVEFGSDKCGAHDCNLHAVWDSGLIQHRKLSLDQYKAGLERDIKQTNLQAGASDPAMWASESKVLADAAVVAKGGNVDEAYYAREIPVVDRQLELAGLRLAAALNTIFTNAPAKFHPAALNPSQQ